MTDSKIPEIQAILTEIDGLLRERLKALEVDLHHVLLAITNDGTGIVHSNTGPEALGEMADLLAEIADDVVTSRPHNEHLN